MDLFKLLGTIAIDNQKANTALKETSNAAKGTASDIGGVGDSGSKTSGKFASAMGKIGSAAVKVGAVAATGIATAGAAIAGITVKALNAAGELEQNMGGSEAVFGEYAGNMQNTAKTAFSNMGLSASDFLATANKMGALFQGAGFGIEESATLSADAMQRAADVASIMGIDTASAMEAVAGAAKGNFTMMDNLGVAMNDTTLNAYALEKGINKTTQEMTNQEKIGLAMELFMEKTAYAAGNYAKENDTLAGSLGTAKAALSNFLSGAGTVEDVVSSLKNAGTVIVRNVKELFPSLMTGITQLVEQLVPEIPPLLNQLLPGILTGATSLITGLVSVLPALLNVITNSVLPQLLSGITTIFNNLVSALPALLGTLLSALPTLIPQVVSSLVSMIITLCTMIPQIIQPIIDNLPSILLSIVDALVTNLPILIDGAISLVLGLVSALPVIFQALADSAPIIIQKLCDGLFSALPQLIVGFGQIILALAQALPQMWGAIGEAWIGAFSGMWESIKNVFANVGEWFSAIWDSIGAGNPAIENLKAYIETVFTAIKNTITTIFNAVKNVISTVWNSIKTTVSTILEAIKNVFSTAWNSIKNTVSTVINAVKTVISTAWEAIKTIIANVMNIIFSIIKGDWESVRASITNIINAIKSVISSVWNAIKSVISSVMQGIKSTISSIWNGIKSTVSSVVNGIKSTISSVFNGIKSTATSVWNGIKTAMTKPIETARDTIKGIVDKIKGFFSNMKLQFPNIKLPHFSISPSGWKIADLLKGSIPKLGIEWYAKAMKNPMVMTSPTIFGYNPKTGKVMGGGDAGSEVVSGTNTLMNMIGDTVESKTSAHLERIIKLLTALLNAIVGGNEELLQALLADKTWKVGEREFARLVKQHA